MMMYSISNYNCTTTSISPISFSSCQGLPNTFENNDTCFSLFHPPSPLTISFEDEALIYPYLQNLETLQPSFSIEDFTNNTNSKEKMVDLSNKKNDENGKTPIKKCPKKKCSKKDRHSKIITSRGPRDRRMRLSIEVAPKFFYLQEMLGFDKPSQTLEWLINKSQWAIMELSRNNFVVDANGAPIVSSTSSVVEESEGQENLKGKNKSSSSSCSKKGRVIRPYAKKTREKARERARERTSRRNKWISAMHKPLSYFEMVDEVEGLSSSQLW